MAAPAPVYRPHWLTSHHRLLSLHPRPQPPPQVAPAQPMYAHPPVLLAQQQHSQGQQLIHAHQQASSSYGHLPDQQAYALNSYLGTMAEAGLMSMPHIKRFRQTAQLKGTILMLCANKGHRVLKSYDGHFDDGLRHLSPLQLEPAPYLPARELHSQGLSHQQLWRVPPITP